MKKFCSDPESLPCPKSYASKDTKAKTGEIDLILELTLAPAY